MSLYKQANVFLKYFQWFDGVGSFFYLSESYIPIREENDRMRWKLKRNGDFTM